MFSFIKKMLNKPAKERRVTPRFDKIFIAQCEVDGKKTFTTVMDISRSGLGIFIEKPIEIGTNIKIILQHEYKNGAYDSNQINLTLPAKVMWIKEEEPSQELGKEEVKDKNYRLGLQLDKLAPEIEKQYLELINFSGENNQEISK